jgi:hypothetical protein
MKKELVKYYDGDVNCKGCKGCKNDEVLECYIQLKQGFIDDAGKIHLDRDMYIRDNAEWCCGQELKIHPDNEHLTICEICGKSRHHKTF